MDTSHTIYEELLSVKADLLRLEEKIQECENNMKHAEGDALEDLMKQYTSLTHAFETGGGYLYRSELVGVLKDWVLPKMNSPSRLPRSPAVRRPVWR